jgi:protein-S-isoprenylcysteine O-methyltransferase Ste14
MAWLAFGIYLTGMVAAFGVRTWLHYRTTGDTGHRIPATGTAGWWAQLLMVAGAATGVVALLLAAIGTLRPIEALDHSAVQIAGLIVTLAGFAGILAAQHAMGTSWRIGVDPTERTGLVTDGVFALVRNPVFTATLTAVTGLTAMVPTWLQLAALACVVAGIELQVRAVEEPYLARLHGHAYTTYTARTGRFLPRIGHTKNNTTTPPTRHR